MDDDQFQGNLSVQGGNPEPVDNSMDIGASTFVLGEAEKTASEQDAANVVESSTAEAEPESEMSRRMNEILGSFDDGIATATAISSGKGKVVQGTAVRADAPKPDFAQAPAAAPVQAEVTTATEGVYDTASTADDAPLGSEAVPSAPITTEETSAMPVAPVEPVAPAGPMPSFTGVPRSNIEQAAAEQAARNAVEAEKNKKIDPKILAGMVACALIIITAWVFVFIKLTNPKKPPVTPQTVQGNPEDKPNINEDTTQRIGTPEHGYIDVPSDWVRLVEGVNEGEFAYSDEGNKNRVIMTSFTSDAVGGARQFANSQYSAADNSGTAVQPQMAEMKISNYDAFQVFYYTQDVKEWTFKYIFDAEDGRVHYIQLIVTDNTSQLVNSVPESWSLNQNETKKQESEGEETEAEVPKTEENNEAEQKAKEDADANAESDTESEDEDLDDSDEDVVEEDDEVVE